MKVGIDVSMLVYRGSGVATYTYNLVKNLLKYDKKNEYRVFYSSLRRPKNFYYLEELRKLDAQVCSFRLPPRLLRLFWNRQHILSIEKLIGKVDIYHSSDFLRPPLQNDTLGVTTIHDLTWKLYPEWHTRDIVAAHERKLNKTIKYGDIIIVDSKNTKKDLLKFYPHINKNKVFVIYPGIDEQFRPIKDKKKTEKILRKYLPNNSKFLLYVGAIEPRKNLTTAIKIFAELVKEEKYSDYKFLIVGRAGWKNEVVFQQVEDLGLKDKVNFLGFVKDEDLPYFYNAARVFIYLSLYEGFGLPPLESARCGVPSLIYKNSSLAEVFPENYPFAKPEAELEVLTKLLEESRQEIDLSFCRQYSWENYCRRFLQIISHSSSME